MSSATLLRMAARTTRELAGAIVRDERARRGLNQAKAAEAWSLAAITLTRLESGVATIKATTLRQVEGGLELPSHFLDYVVEGDVERLRRIPGLREDLRHYVIESLEDIESPPRRRATDER